MPIDQNKKCKRPTKYLKKRKRPTKDLSREKKADILQMTFKHYFEMAMDHHTKAGTTSQLLMVIVGALIAFIGVDGNVTGKVDFFSGLAIAILGIFGVLWAKKQHERYHYWEYIAYEYQKELTKIMLDLKTAKPESQLALDAEVDSAEKFGLWFAKYIEDRYLWVSLHFLVIFIGLVIMVLCVWPFYVIFKGVVIMVLLVGLIFFIFN